MTGTVFALKPHRRVIAAGTGHPDGISQGESVKLPNSDLAYVDRDKIYEYLLSASHPDGSHKARFFKRFGYTTARWERLADDLKEHARRHSVVKTMASQHGVRYTMDGVIETPDGRRPRIRTVWFIRKNDARPRFITAYPLRSRYDQGT
jgi:hypothetical protein